MITMQKRGDGFGLFMDNTLLKDDVMLDNQVLINYILEDLGGVVSAEYANLQGQGRITIYQEPFADVVPGDWYADDVSYVYTKGFMNGTSDTTFLSDAPISNAMFVAMLYREAGSPVVSQKVSDLLSDCADNLWYSDAAAWAARNWLPLDGDVAFQPDSVLSRQDMAYLLYQYIKSEDGGFSGAWAYLPEYTDLDAIGDRSYEAVAYCSMKGLINGLDTGEFAPASATTRAMAAVILQRFDSMMNAVQ